MPSSTAFALNCGDTAVLPLALKTLSEDLLCPRCSGNPWCGIGSAPQTPNEEYSSAFSGEEASAVGVTLARVRADR